MADEEEKNIISSLGVSQIFEGIGNIINIVGNVTEEGSIASEKEQDEKAPVCSNNSQ